MAPRGARRDLDAGTTGNVNQHERNGRTGLVSSPVCFGVMRLLLVEQLWLPVACALDNLLGDNDSISIPPHMGNYSTLRPLFAMRRRHAARARTPYHGAQKPVQRVEESLRH